MPSAEEVEKSVLATMISDNQCINTVMSLIKDEKVFYLEANQKIFRAIKDFIENNPPNALNPAILIQKLKDNDQLEEIGGANYLLEILKWSKAPKN